jgi:hypothetical protein
MTVFDPTLPFTRVGVNGSVRPFSATQPSRRERLSLPQMRHSETTPSNDEVLWISDIGTGFLHGLRCF